MQLKDSIICRVHKGKYGDISVTFRVKPEDVKGDMERVLWDAWTAGIPWEVDLTPFQIEESSKKTLRGKGSIYQEFKNVCETIHGADFYEREKAILGVKHLVELENKYSPNEIETMLYDRMYEIKKEAGFYDDNL